MFKEMRRKDRQTDLATAKQILEKGVVGVFSTIGENGYPTGIPFNYAMEDDYIYLHSAVNGYSHENVTSNPNISFTVINRCDIVAEEFATNYESVVVHGKAEIANDEDKMTGLRAFVKKYSSNFLKEGFEHVIEDFNFCVVFKIHIENITGKIRNGNN